MNRDVLETQWVQAKEFLRDKWSRLTEEDLRQINGRFDQLSDKLQQRYGYTSAQAEEEIRKWNFDRAGTERMGADRTTSSGRSAYSTEKTYMRQDDKNAQRDEGSSALKWLLALALPLLLLALYLGSTKSYDATTSAASAEQISFTAQTPADQAIGQSIRQAFSTSGMPMQDMRNLQFTSSDGFVTVSGTVANSQERDRILNLLRNIDGVKQINNQMIIRP